MIIRDRLPVTTSANAHQSFFRQFFSLKNKINIQTKLLQIFPPRGYQGRQTKGNRNGPAQYVLHLQDDIETAQLYSTPTQRNDDIKLATLAQTTNSFSPKPLNLAYYSSNSCK